MRRKLDILRVRRNLLKCNKQIKEYIFEDEEVSKVKYVYYKELERMVEDRVEGLLIHEEEYKYLFKYIRTKISR